MTETNKLDQPILFPVERGALVVLDGTLYEIESYNPSTGLVRTTEGEFGEARFLQMVKDADTISIE